MAVDRHSVALSEYMNHKLLKLAFGVDVTYLVRFLEAKADGNTVGKS